MKMSGQLKTKRIEKNNQNSSNNSEEVSSLTNDGEIRSQLYQVRERLSSVKLSCDSSSSEENSGWGKEEATNNGQEEVSAEKYNKLGSSFDDWFNWNKNQRRKALLAAENNNRNEMEDFKCSNLTEKSFPKSCLTPTIEVANNDENERTPLQQDDKQVELNNTKTSSLWNNENKSKTPQSSSLQQDDKLVELNNTKTPSEWNNVSKSKNPERSPLQQDDKQDQVNNTETPSASNSENKSKTLQQDDKQVELNNTKAPSEWNNVNKSKNPERSPLQQDDKQDQVNNTETPSASNSENKSKTPERTPLRQDVMGEKVCNLRPPRELYRVAISKAQCESNKTNLSKTSLKTSLQPNDLRLKLNKSKAPQQSNKLNITSPESSPMQQRLLRSRLRKTPFNTQEEVGRVQVEKRSPEKQVNNDEEIIMMAGDSMKGMSASPCRLLDVLAQHNQENSKVVAGLDKCRLVDLREKLLTERPISFGEKTVSEETSINSCRQAKTSKINVRSSCSAQDRLLKLKSNR